MHTPEDKPRFSQFYDYEIHPFVRPPELDGRTGRRARVVVVGAGPIGMLVAIELARHGVDTILLEAELQVSHGSRAIVLTRRSMEILEHAGIEAPFVAKGLQWSTGRSYYKGREIYRMVMPHDEDDRFLPGLNIQQQYIEEFLVRAVSASPRIELRWGSKVVGIEQDDTRAVLRVDTPEGEYDLEAEWVVAADGGRSTLRKLLNLRMEGRSYAGNFVIADIVADIGLPTERLCHFDPDWNPGNNVLVHRQPDGLWRIDFRLPEAESAELALAPARLAHRIDLVLDMIGRKVPWKLDWATVYSANTLTLPHYVAGRVAFTGDAAHLLPIFGVRGANTGIQDAGNLAWKLAAVAKGEAKRALLETYSSERVHAAREICEEGGKSTRFMTPPSDGYRLMRDAVLSFALSEDFSKDLLHWRTSRPHSYAGSPLSSPDESDGEFAGGIACGDPMRDVRLAPEAFFLQRLSQPGFHLVCFAGDSAGDDVVACLRAAAGARTRVNGVLVAAQPTAAMQAVAGIVVADPERRIFARYAARPGTAYLVRPDQHVCARWYAPTPDRFTAALDTALGDWR